MEAPEELQVKHIHVGFITQLWWLLLQEAEVQSVNLFKIRLKFCVQTLHAQWFTNHISS